MIWMRGGRENVINGRFGRSCEISAVDQMYHGRKAFVALN